MSENRWIVIGALLALIGVALGAFGAHALEGMLVESEDDPGHKAKQLANWQTGVRYQLVHALGVIVIGVASERLRMGWANAACWLMVVGILLFSGCLYGWVLTESKPLVMIVPLGGLSFLVGWFCLTVSAWLGNRPSSSTLKGGK